MHFVKAISAVFVISVSGVGCGIAQSSAQSQLPAENPPIEFTGKQYVDSRGCVFIRAGIDGNVTWVPRITRSRELLCGFSPTSVETTAHSVPAPVEVANETVVVEKMVPAKPSTTVARPARRSHRVAVAAAPMPSSFQVPRGFRVAWTDGRLNPNRGPRTAKGNAQTDMVWQQKVPRVLIQKTQPITVASASAQYVQVGAYGLSSNVDTVVGWLQKKNLPVGLSATRRGGKKVQLVLAGPFSSQDKLDEVLAMTHRAGFSDSFIR